MPTELRERYTRILNIVKDAHELEKNNSTHAKGYDKSRLSLESSKQLENLAYEVSPIDDRADEDEPFSFYAYDSFNPPEPEPDLDTLISIFRIEEEIQIIRGRLDKSTGTQSQVSEEKEEEVLTEDIAQPVDLWMKRFSTWNSAIDRVSQNVKAKFVKMKSDILKAIRSIMKERTNPEKGKVESNKQAGGR